MQAMSLRNGKELKVEDKLDKGEKVTMKNKEKEKDGEPT